MAVTGIVELAEGWSSLQKGIEKVTWILEGRTDEQLSSEQYMLLYSEIYQMCIQRPPYDYAAQLYEKYKNTFEVYITSTVMPSLRKKHDEIFLRELVKRWNIHKNMVRLLSRFFNYLDRFYVVRMQLPALEEVGLVCFRDLAYQELKSRAVLFVITLIHQEREGKKIDRILLKNAVDIFIEIGMGQMNYYEENFEISILNATTDYYSQKASVWIVEDSCPNYMLKAEESLKKEKDCVSHYLHPSSETKLLEQVQNELLVVHAYTLLDKECSGCRILLKADKVEDLSRMYQLFHKIPKGLEHSADTFKQHVTAEGMAAIGRAKDATNNKVEKESGADDLEIIEEEIKLHKKYMEYVLDCFSNSALFHKALSEAFQTICNKVVFGNSHAELLASYTDKILKKGGNRKLSDEDNIDETLENVVQLLVYVHDKDIFAEFHRKKLSRRLLFDKNTNDEYETLMLTKLKRQCGGQFTSKMEGMVTDLILARENNKQFQEYLRNNQAANPGLDLNVTLLTTGFWPSYKSCDLRLPDEMAKCVEVFKGFYKTKTQHRKLTWIYSLGTCSITTTFEEKRFELIMGTYQGAVLLLFNDADRLSYTDIKTQLNLDDEDLIRILRSLSCAKYKILNKEPNTKSVSENDYFEYNSKFTDKMRRLRIPLPPVDDRKKMAADVDKDRRYAIDAALVRIMKNRKVLGIQQLIAECVEMLKSMFKPDVKLIKRRMDELMARDYLARDAENSNLFKYVA